MKVEIRFLATIRGITGESRVEVICNPHETAGTIMQELVEKYGKNFEQALMEGTGLKPGIMMIINGRDIDYLDGLDTELKEGDVIVLIPPVAGG